MRLAAVGCFVRRRWALAAALVTALCSLPRRSDCFKLGIPSPSPRIRVCAGWYTPRPSRMSHLCSKLLHIHSGFTAHQSLNERQKTILPLAQFPNLCESSKVVYDSGRCRSRSYRCR